MTPHQSYRLISIGNSLHLEVKLGEHWRPVYSFDSVDYYPIDFQAANWLVSTYPKSEFVRNLVIARPTADRRQILNNTQLSIRHADGGVEADIGRREGVAFHANRHVESHCLLI